MRSVTLDCLSMCCPAYVRMYGLRYVLSKYDSSVYCSFDSVFFPFSVKERKRKFITVLRSIRITLTVWLEQSTFKPPAAFCQLSI